MGVHDSLGILVFSHQIPCWHYIRFSANRAYNCAAVGHHQCRRNADFTD